MDLRELGCEEENWIGSIGRAFVFAVLNITIMRETDHTYSYVAMQNSAGQLTYM
jgi:hypothetical protein